MTARVVERRIVSVLFADLVGFTSLSERLDAEDVSLVQDAYFDAVRETIERHGGQLEKFIGDAAMAVFGAPRVRDDDAERAVRAGLALVAAVSRLGASLGLDEGALQLRVGVNSGEALYGEATADRGAVTGDTVNVAARLQASAEPGSVVVGEITALAIGDAVQLDRLEALALKGKADMVPAWKVVGLYPERSRERALAGLRAPTIGREAELERLLAPLGGGSCRIVVVAPPGVGKTRLLEEHGLAAERNGAALLRARLRPDFLSPFEPIGQLVRSVGAPADVIGRLPSGRGEVVRDALAAVVAPVEAASGLSDERDRMFGSWLEGLDALAADRPAVWQVEDLHWASADLLAFLDFAAEQPARHGRLLVGTARPVLLEQAAEWCDAGDILHLDPLPEAKTAALVRGLVGDALPQPLVERIAERSGGNALFVEELLRTWVSTGALVAENGAWVLALEADDIFLPPTVQAIYAGQLDDLPGPVRTAARRAAVAGRRFPVSALRPLGVPEPDDAVETLARRALVAAVPDDPVLGESYVYRHALLRDVGYASLARNERASLHLSLAEWLAGLPEEARPTVAEVVARHYAAALENVPELAGTIGTRSRSEVRAAGADWFERAAEIASRFSAWDSARALAARSLDLTDEGADLLRARRLELVAGSTAKTVGVAAAEALLREALDLYRAGRPHDEAAARLGLASAGAAVGQLLGAQTRFAEAEGLADALLKEIGPQEDVATARLLVMRASAIVNAWDDYERAEEDVARALAVAREASDPLLELGALEVRAGIQAERGDAAAEESWANVSRLAGEAGDWVRTAAALRIRASLRADADSQEALALLDDAQELGDAHGLLEGRGWCDYGRAEVYFGVGRWDDATAAALRAIDLAGDHGFQRMAIRSWFVLLPIADARGQDELVRRSYELFAARKGKEPDSLYARIIATAAHLHFAKHGLEPGFVPDVESRLASFDLDHNGASWLAAVDTLVETWLEAGLGEGISEALDRMKVSVARHDVPSVGAGVEPVLRARLFETLGEIEAAAGAAERALGLLGPQRLWWRAKAIRVLERAGSGSPDLTYEARSTEEALLGNPRR